eukprot:Lithocolla_globosa_v1_NODE_1670_length_2408_cov_13.956226.p2 type:complete len:251 gc:universal NODE_1670_length_2408_cov_13.956226:141-893(+)
MFHNFFLRQETDLAFQRLRVPPSMNFLFRRRVQRVEAKHLLAHGPYSVVLPGFPGQSCWTGQVDSNGLENLKEFFQHQFRNFWICSFPLVENCVCLAASLPMGNRALTTALSRVQRSPSSWKTAKHFAPIAAVLAEMIDDDFITFVELGRLDTIRPQNSQPSVAVTQRGQFRVHFVATCATLMNTLDTTLVTIEVGLMNACVGALEHLRDTEGDAALAKLAQPRENRDSRPHLDQRNFRKDTIGSPMSTI